MIHFLRCGFGFVPTLQFHTCLFRKGKSGLGGLERFTYLAALGLMVGLSTIDHVLWFLSAVLPILIIGRIVQQRLYRAPFDALALMLGVVVARDVLLACLRYDSHPYVLVWSYSLPVILVSQIYAGLQTLISVARLYPRFGRLAVLLFLTCLALTLAFCCVGLPFELHRLSGGEAVLRSFFLAQRWVDSSIAGTLILTSLFLMRSPAPPKQPPFNLVLHTTLLSIYFSGYAVLFFVENLTSLGSAQIFERAQFSLIVVLYLMWASCLSLKRQRPIAWKQIEAFSLRRVPTPTESTALHFPFSCSRKS